MSRIANEAATKAKRVRSKEIRRQKRDQAYTALQAAMPSLLGGLMGGAKSDAAAAALRAAIAEAKEAGVSLVTIREAEEALRKM